jgi:hypothetical protein
VQGVADEEQAVSTWQLAFSQLCASGMASLLRDSRAKC